MVSFRRIARKINWTAVTASSEQFAQLILGAPDLWMRLGDWAGRSSNLFNKVDIHRRIIRSLWGFTLGQTFADTSEALCIEGPNHQLMVAERHRPLARHSPLLDRYPRHSFDAWQRLEPFHHQYTKMLLELMHDDAHRILRTNSTNPLLPAAHVRSFSSCSIAFYNAVGRTYRWVYAELHTFPGVVLTGFAHEGHALAIPEDSTNATCLLDADEKTIDYAALSDRMKQRMQISLWAMLRPTDPVFLGPHEDLHAWLGFFIHPLFQKLLPIQPWNHPRVIVQSSFFTPAGAAAPGLTHYTRHRDPQYPNITVFWPAADDYLVKVGLQLYANYALAVKTSSRVFFTEWIQARAITSIIRNRKQAEFDALAVDKMDFNAAEHRPLVHVEEMDAVVIVFPRALPRVDAVHVVARKPSVPSRPWGEWFSLRVFFLF